MLGGVYYFACVCVSMSVSVPLCVHVQNFPKHIESINFILGGRLPSDPGRKPFEFELCKVGVGSEILAQ